jgi:hypothetical protein
MRQALEICGLFALLTACTVAGVECGRAEAWKDRADGFAVTSEGTSINLHVCEVQLDSVGRTLDRCEAKVDLVREWLRIDERKENLKRSIVADVVKGK